jgi:predicted HicB family RNase H-like nuclease
MCNAVGNGTTPSQPTEEQLELRLPEEIITKLAFEAEFRGVGIGELIGALIAATMEKDLLQLILDAEKVKK